MITETVGSLDSYSSSRLTNVLFGIIICSRIANRRILRTND